MTAYGMLLDLVHRVSLMSGFTESSKLVPKLTCAQQTRNEMIQSYPIAVVHLYPNIWSQLH